MPGKPREQGTRGGAGGEASAPMIPRRAARIRRRVDRLFGVTMAERGVSQLVSVDLAHAVRLRQTA